MGEGVVSQGIGGQNSTPPEWPQPPNWHFLAKFVESGIFDDGRSQKIAKKNVGLFCGQKDRPKGFPFSYICKYYVHIHVLVCVDNDIKGLYGIFRLSAPMGAYEPPPPWWNLVSRQGGGAGHPVVSTHVRTLGCVRRYVQSFFFFKEGQRQGKVCKQQEGILSRNAGMCVPQKVFNPPESFSK